VWFTHCLEYLVVFNTDPSTSVSIRFCILIMYKMCSYYYYYHFFFCNFAYRGLPGVWYVFCVMCVIVLYCTVQCCIFLSCILAHCHLQLIIIIIIIIMMVMMMMIIIIIIIQSLFNTFNFRNKVRW